MYESATDVLCAPEVFVNSYREALRADTHTPTSFGVGKTQKAKSFLLACSLFLIIPSLPAAEFGPSAGACPDTIWDDDFETAGPVWTVNPTDQDPDSASAGIWERGIPQVTSYNGDDYQLAAFSGSYTLVTDSRGGDVNAYDVDAPKVGRYGTYGEGITSILSEAISVPGDGSGHKLELRYNFAYTSTAFTSNRFAVNVLANGISTTVFSEWYWEELPGTHEDQPGAWEALEVDLSQWAGDTIEIEFVAGNSLADAVVEAQVDDVRVCYTAPIPNTPPTITAPADQVNIVGDTIDLATPLVLDVEDAEGDDITSCDIDGEPDSLQVGVDANNDCIIWGTINDSAGDYTVTVTATDDGGLPSDPPAEFTWTVLPPTGVAMPDTVPDPADPPFILSDIVEDSSKVGETSGQFRVDQSGSATYSIPILTAPGSGGFEPKISLNYSSQDGNGVLGVGWSIGGLSSITRCGQTFAQDEELADPGITLTDSDRFCLDGERLMLISNDDYGDPGAEYRLERDTIVKVVSNGTAGNGPQSFTVWRKDGTVSEYGATNDSRIEARTVEDSDTILIWAQNRISDSATNYIDFDYDELFGSAGDPIEYVLTHVKYTGNSGVPQLPYAELVFIYDGNRNDDSERSVAGSTLALTQRLVRIDSVTSDPASETLRSYFLEYDDDGFGREILQSVTECSDANQDPSDPNDICFSPAYFGWHKSNHEVDPDHPDAPNPISLNAAFNDPLKYEQTALADINGDARPDLLITEKNGSNFEFRIALALPGGGFAAASTQAYSIPSYSGGTAPVQLYAIDLNADGNQDVIYPANDTWKYRLSNGSGLGSPSDATQGDDCCGQVNPQIVWVMDADGDGLADLVTSNGLGPEGSSLTFLRNNYSPASPASIGFDQGLLISLSVRNDDVFPDEVAPNYHLASNDVLVGHWVGHIDPRRSTTLDFDGDGATDVLMELTARYCQPDGPLDPNCPPDLDVPGDEAMNVILDREDWNSEDGLGTQYFDIPFIVAMASSGGVFRSNGVVGVRETCPVANPALCGMHPGAAQGVEDFVATDINGDGLGDFVYTTVNDVNDDFRDAWIVRMNRGGVFDTGDLFITDPMTPIHYQLADLSRFVDLNGDGYPELLAPRSNSGNPDWDVWFNQFGMVFGAKVQSGIRFGNLNQGDISVFADFSGDGMLDNLFINFNSSSQLDLSATRLYKGFNDQANGTHAANVIDLISTGVGQQRAEQITYKPLTDSSVYTRMNDSSEAVWGSGHAVYDLVAPLYVVSEVTSSTPVYGTPGATSSVEYHYVGAKVQGGGRGFLGFGEMVVFDNATDIRTNTRYRQDFPFIGMPADITQALPANGRELAPVSNVTQTLPVVWGSVTASTQPQLSLGNDDLLRYTINELDDLETESGKGTMFSFTAKSLERRYTLAGNLERKTFTTLNYDGINGRYGNLTSSTVQTYGNEGASWVASQSTSNQYGDDDIDEWLLGRLTFTTVTHKRPGETDRVRRSAFDYDMDAPPSERPTGILKQEVIEPTNNQYKVVTDYTLDSYGNRDSITVTGYERSGMSWGPMDERETDHIYDDLGRFIEESRNSYNQLTYHLISWDAFGNPTLSENIDGVQTVVNVDYMGRPYQTYTQLPDSPSPQFSGESTHSLHDLGTGGFCPSGSGLTSFYTYTGKAGRPDEVQCFDILGREIRSLTQGFADQTWTSVDTYYDSAGRVARVSEPRFLGAATHWNHTAYDELGRVDSILAVDGNDMTYQYDEQASRCMVSGAARQVLTQNGLNQFRLEVRNALGELVDVYDDLCGSVSYEYDAVGNMDSITGVDNEESTMDYDLAGRKTYHFDPDSGVREYVYNSLGEVTRQYDAKSQAIDFKYDELGRITDRLEYDFVSGLYASGTVDYHESTTWNNFSSIPGKGQVLNSAYQGAVEGLIEQRNFEYDDFGRATEVETINDGALFNQYTTYGEFGRVFQQFDVTGDDRGLQYHYNAQGYLWKVQEAREGSQSADVYEEILAMDQRLNVTERRLGEGNGGAGLIVEHEYHDDSGRLHHQLATASDGPTDGVQSIEYTFDELGNLEVRDDSTAGRQFYEKYYYDDLNRLTGVTIPGGGFKGEGSEVDILALAYDPNGNITTKMGVGVYEYEETGNAGPHAVTKVLLAGGGQVTYEYDENGNMTSGNARDDITYTVFNKPKVVEMNSGISTEFTYGIGQSRSKRVDTYPGGATKTTWYIGNVERIQWNGGEVHSKRYLGGNAIMDCTPGCHPHLVSYLVKDHLDSIYAMTDADGSAASVENLSFMPFGQRRIAGDSDPLDSGATELLNDRTTRGYTGHEHADQVGLIHMNGRTYDPWLGRFMQADPIVQDPMNGQNLNRYTYVLNNPLTYTDPSGYTFVRGGFSWTRDDWFRPSVGSFLSLISRDGSYRWNGSFSSEDYFRLPPDYVRNGVSFSPNSILANLAAGTVPGSYSRFKVQETPQYLQVSKVRVATVGGTYSDMTELFATPFKSTAMIYAMNDCSTFGGCGGAGGIEDSLSADITVRIHERLRGGIRIDRDGISSVFKLPIGEEFSISIDRDGIGKVKVLGDVITINDQGFIDGAGLDIFGSVQVSGRVVNSSEIQFSARGIKGIVGRFIEIGGTINRKIDVREAVESNSGMIGDMERTRQEYHRRLCEAYGGADC